MIEAPARADRSDAGPTSPPPLRIEAMQLFCDVARYRSFTRIAREHRLTQPGVSWSVRQLEKRLGVSLIDRARRPWQLTPEGRVFYRGCADLLDRYRRLEQAVRHAGAGPAAELRLAAIYSVGPGPMNRYLQRFAALQPGVRVHLEYARPDGVIQSVLEESADLGIVSYPPSRRDLAVVPWREEPMAVVCPPRHRLAGLRAVAPSDLRDEAFVGFDADLTIRHHIDRFLGRHRVPVNVVMSFDNVESIKRAVEAGSGVSILPQPTLDRERRMRTLQAVPFSVPPPMRSLGLIHRRGQAGGQPLAQLIAHLTSGDACHVASK